jgi:hypothetical protein
MTVTLVTSASVEMRRIDNRTDVKALFIPRIPEQPAPPKTTHVPPEPFLLETNGAIIESAHPEGKRLEIIDFYEFKSRFPQYRTGSHFCYLTGVGTDDERCDDRDCSGVCVLHPNPKFCSCD